MNTFTSDWLRSQRLFHYTEKRFWSRVNKTSTCWLWTGPTYDKLKYGMIQLSGNGMAIFSAHRFSWLLHGNSIPEGMCVLHRCDIPQCVNPNHLFLGTKGDNCRDRTLKGRSSKGILHHNHKLTNDDVIKIRCLWSAGLANGPSLSRMFGIHPCTAWAIATKRTWKHI